MVCVRMMNPCYAVNLVNGISSIYLEDGPLREIPKITSPIIPYALFL